MNLPPLSPGVFELTLHQQFSLNQTRLAIEQGASREELGALLLTCQELLYMKDNALNHVLSGGQVDE